MGNALQNVIILDGRLVGTWRRVIDKKARTAELNWLIAPTENERGAVVAAAERYGQFIGLKVAVQ